MITHYKALDIAKYTVGKCTIDGHQISNMYLQKILYYIQRDFLRMGEILFYEPIEAWAIGPVVPEVYYHYCGYAAMPIYVPDSILKSQENIIDVWTATVINPIIRRKRILQPWDLVQDVHAKGKAWDLTYKDGNGDHMRIPNDLIKTKG